MKCASFLKVAFAASLFAVSLPSYGATVIEFYNTNLDNYFITADAAEATAIDNGSAGAGWVRTGHNFESGSGTSPVCRFSGWQTHYYTIDADVCAYLKQIQLTAPATENRWIYEGVAFNSTPRTNFACPAGSTPIYAAFYSRHVNGLDSVKRRITSSQVAIQEVLARGWTNEGVVMCAGSLTVSYRDTVSHLPNTPYLSYEQANISRQVGEYVTFTNVWGPQAAISYTETISATIHPTDGVYSFINEWDVISSSTPGVVMYGSIIYGKRYVYDYSTTTKLPVKIDSMSDLIVSGNEKVVCFTVCKYNSLVDIWVTPTDRPAWGSAKTEIVIHLNGTWLSEWPIDGIATLGGVLFYAHSGYIPGYDWKIIMYEPVNNISVNTFRFNMKEVMADAVAKNYIKMSDYLVSIEIGTEVMSGRGKTEITNYSIQ